MGGRGSSSSSVSLSKTIVKEKTREEQKYLFRSIVSTEKEAAEMRQVGVKAVSINDFNKKFGLSNSILGTEKQSVYANKIRADIMRQVFRENTDFSQTKERNRLSKIANKKDAKYWIDKKGLVSSVANDLGAKPNENTPYQKYRSKNRITKV